ncbi:MAG: hypothetical protein Fur005_42450 [Roseiflexaceae bacterium]
MEFRKDLQIAALRKISPDIKLSEITRNKYCVRAYHCDLLDLLRHFTTSINNQRELALSNIMRKSFCEFWCPKRAGAPP